LGKKKNLCPPAIPSVEGGPGGEDGKRGEKSKTIPKKNSGARVLKTPSHQPIIEDRDGKKGFVTAGEGNGRIGGGKTATRQ